MTNQNNPSAKPDQSVADKAKQSAGTVAEQAKETVDSAVESARRTAASQAGEVKSSVANEVSGVASALRTAAEEMRSGSPQERTFGQIAEGLADASDALREKDLSTMVEDVTKFARKNPLVFLGGAALIGFAATRFAKASEEVDTATPSQPSQYTASRSTHGDLT
jgi:predicted amidohydrolase YtcJ